MTDRTISLIVTLHREIRIDDIESTMNAIRMIKNVLSVHPNIFTGSDQMNAAAARSQLKGKILDEFFLLLDKI